jgi:hypothetical protein
MLDTVYTIADPEISRKTHRYGFYEDYLPYALIGYETMTPSEALIRKGIEEARQIHAELESPRRDKYVKNVPDVYKTRAEVIEYLICDGTARVLDFIDIWKMSKKYPINIGCSAKNRIYLCAAKLEPFKRGEIYSYQSLSEGEAAYAYFLMRYVRNGDLKLPEELLKNDPKTYDKETRRKLRTGEMKFQTTIQNWWESPSKIYEKTWLVDMNEYKYEPPAETKKKFIFW